MKNFLILCSIFLLAFFVRFYHFEDRIIFWTEQALSLITSLNYLDKPSLLGQEYFRYDSNSHVIYSGALFNYLLLPLTLISNYNPVKITMFFTILNLLTGLGVYLVSRRYFGIKTAMYSSILFLFSSLMIYHSLFIWNYNFLPLVGLTLFYLTLKNHHGFKLNHFFYLGLVSGIGISIQIIFVFYTVIVFFVNIFKSNQKTLAILYFLFGLIIGNLPMVLFDLRHDFYQLNTIWQYLLDSLKGSSDANFAYYYLLPLIPMLSICVGWVLSKINNFVSVPILILYLFLNLRSLVINPDITVSQLDFISREIANDAKGDFNVASDIDFDKRAYPIRYYLKYKYEKKVSSVENYKNISTLYVLAPIGHNFNNSSTWEISAGWPYKVQELQSINSKYSLYKLTK